MTEDQVLRALRSVGMTAFVTHLELFEGPLSNADATTRLQHRSGWTLTGCRTRVSCARRILAAGHRSDALHLIVAASNLPDAVRDAARRAI